MKIRRYLAPDLRQALRQVREAQGPDAVILSTRRLGEEVEVVAAIDYEAAAAPEVAVAPAAAVAAEDAPPEEFATIVKRTLAEARTADERASRAGEPVERDTGMGEELRTMRRLLETQLAALAWNDLTRRAPLRTALLKELTELGIATDLAAEIAAAVPPDGELVAARRMAFARIAGRLPVASDRWLGQGGLVALAGASGAGKTTVLAKLAARWVLRHGSRELTLISCDGARFGAHEQLRTLGQILDVPVHTLGGIGELADVLPRLGTQRLVLIDTAGSGPRDTQLPAQLAALGVSVPRFETALVLAATTQAAALEETVRRFAPAAPQACLLTRLDEAVSLGGALSVLMRVRLPLVWLSEGERVPEDLRPARALELVARAVELAREHGAAADEDLLARRFGGGARAIA